MAVSKRPIVVGVDGSAPSSAAVSWAAAEARRHHVELHLVIAGDPARADYAEETVYEVAARCRREDPDLEVTEEVVVDHPVHALVNRSAQAQMIAVGCRGHSRFVNALLGSVSAPVAARSACPVVVVRHGR
ncbi:nucleotide-binding universal stress UspA family protein [Halopolyspora algeriensis]|uniref:Nucleotide-binding universal stress UspA family protein n=1 Tax=Halopolyspora algeriensis TaxID=1500506 RepID=A0A368VRP1_9ACTN|nr:universal stress protein [Halopolyspora algeriensis]RCW43675.1 nucleotide-binding universal stress UspA family protein [Halopolyspora algeriensis]TQM47542.1 nucleotide-binding universal stress UspA family protein [Halopolyspora algeriensis]